MRALLATPSSRHDGAAGVDDGTVDLGGLRVCREGPSVSASAMNVRRPWLRRMRPRCVDGVWRADYTARISGPADARAPARRRWVDPTAGPSRSSDHE